MQVLGGIEHLYLMVEVGRGTEDDSGHQNWVCTGTHMGTHTYVQGKPHAHVHTCVYTHVNVDTHTHIHTCHTLVKN